MPELHVRAVSARNLLDKQTFGRQDPYCKLTVRNRTFKTRVHDNGDKSPVWNERFTFEVYDPQLDQLRVEVKDKNFTASVLIGECRLPVNMFLHGNVVDQWFPLNNGHRGAGEINLRVQLVGAGVSGGKAASMTAPMAYAQPAGYAPPGYPVPQQQAAYPPQGAYPQQQYAQQQQQQQQQQWQQQQLQQQQQQIHQQQQQIAQQQAQIAANTSYAYAPPPPPPPMVIAPPPVVYAPPPPVVYGAPPPVMYGAPGYIIEGPRHHHHHDDGGYYGGRRGGGGGDVALGVGAGVLGVAYFLWRILSFSRAHNPKSHQAGRTKEATQQEMVELHVRAVCARNLLDKQTFGKQDPYCKITVRNRTFKTRVHDNGDKSPVWNERFTFDAHDPQLDQLVIEVKDKNFTSSTLIGEVRLPVNMFLHGNLVDEWYTLNNGNKRAGEINLRVQLVGPGIGGGKGEKAAVPAPTPAPVAYAQPAVAAAYPAPQQAAAYPPQGAAHAYPPQPQYAQQPHYPPQQPYYDPNQQHYAQHQHYPPPPQQGYAYPPPQPTPVVYGAPAPVIYGAPPPVMYVQGAPGYHDHHHHHHGGHRRRGSGGDAAEMALGVGAGVLGGALLADVLF
ncbi:putative ca2-dependent phospholipid-binding protein, partial [Globisporangium splendens]